MDIQLFSSLMHHLLYENVVELNEQSCVEIEKAYCNIPILQSLYKQERLLDILLNGDNRTIYDFRDLIGISATIIKFDGKTLFIGPFVTREFIEQEIRGILAEHGFSAAYLSSIQMNYGNYPLHSRKFVIDTVTGCLRAMNDYISEIPVIRIRPEKHFGKNSKEANLESFDYYTIFQRYETENRFLSMIENGDTERLFSAFDDMNISGLDPQEYYGAIYQDPGVPLSILKTLARKAAERGGASIIEIDRITQQTTQVVHSSSNLIDARKATFDMLMDLTLAVKKSKEGLNGTSLGIRKVVDFIRMNYSQKISLSQMAETSGYSEPHLSSLFKKELGQTISNYLASIRCEQAARLLISENMSIQDISSYVGYLDNNYFVKVFKKHYHKTPSEYRLAMKKEM